MIHPPSFQIFKGLWVEHWVHVYSLLHTFMIFVRKTWKGTFVCNQPMMA
jgi:hypothetical protein